MNPFVQEILSSLFRKLLAMASVWAVSHGIFTADETQKLIEGAVLLLVSVVWTLWKKYHDRIKFLTALESPPGITECELIAKISDGKGATL
jgi:hypothetical protein